MPVKQWIKEGKKKRAWYSLMAIPRASKTPSLAAGGAWETTHHLESGFDLRSLNCLSLVSASNFPPLFQIDEKTMNSLRCLEVLIGVFMLINLLLTVLTTILSWAGGVSCADGVASRCKDLHNIDKVNVQIDVINGRSTMPNWLKPFTPLFC